MKRLLLILIAAVAATFGLVVPSASAVDVPTFAVHVYGYDCHHHAAQATRTHSERGRPVTAAFGTAHNADGQRPLGVPARLDAAAASPSYDYHDSCRLVEVAHGGHTDDRRIFATSAESVAFQPLHVAAKTADEALTGVDDVLGGLAKGRSSGVRTVGSDAELDDVYGTLTRGGTPVDVPGYKGTWIERSDGVRVGIRDASKSGGRTIDIRYPDGTTGKIHIG